MSRRVLQPSPEWNRSKDQVGVETVIVSVQMDPMEVNKLFFLRRMTGESPFFLVGGEGVHIYHPAPLNRLHGLLLFSSIDKTAPSIYNGRLNAKAGGDQLIAILAKFPMFSLLVSALAGPDTTLYRFFQEHPLAEKQLLFVIISFF